MWVNHPDRRPDAPRELANRRVAIANMLLDRAEAALKANGAAARARRLLGIARRPHPSS